MPQQPRAPKRGDWTPGQSGNPAGRKKGQKDTAPRSKRRLVETVLASIPDEVNTVAGVKAAALPLLADLIDPDRALRELAALAYADPRQLFDEAGNLRPIHTLPPEVAAMVGQFEVVKKNMEAGDGHTDTVHKIKVWDKPKTLQMLLQHLGLLKERHEHTGTFTMLHELP